MFYIKSLLFSLISLLYIYNTNSIYIIIGIIIVYTVYNKIETNVENIIEWIILISIISICTIYNNLLGLFVSIELFNICVYIYLYKQESYINNINIIRYYIISSISSIIYLLGILFVYKEIGDIYIENIEQGSIGIIIIIFSILMKSGIGPFYIWKVELWNQLDPIRLLFVITLPIYLSFYILSNLILYTYHIYIEYILTIYIISTIVIISISYQIYNKINILLLYSSIYNTALIYYNLLIYVYNTIYNIYLYIIIYIINSIGIMYIIDRIKNKGIDNIKLILLTIYLMSYIGIPPLGGFYSKLYMFYGSLSINTIYIYILIIIILISTVFIVPLYLRILYYFSAVIPMSLKDSNDDHLDHLISITTVLLLFSPLLFFYLPLSL